MYQSIFIIWHLATQSISFIIDVNITLPDYLTATTIAYNHATFNVYIFGGIQCDRVTNNLSATIYKRNISNDSEPWVNIAEKTPTLSFWAAAGPSSVTLNDAVYFLGINDNVVESMVYVFNLTTEKFITNPGIPSYDHPNVDGCVVTNSSHIFMFGGLYGSQVLNWIQILDVKMKKWSYDQVLIALWRPLCAMKGNIIFIFGGIQSTEPNVPSDAFYKYDTTDGTLKFLENTGRRYDGGYVAFFEKENIIYIRSREYILKFNVTDETLIDDEDDIFETAAPVTYAPMIIHNDTLTIFGGQYLHQSDLIFGTQCTAWTQSVALPLVRNKVNSTCINVTVINITESGNGNDKWELNDTGMIMLVLTGIESVILIVLCGLICFCGWSIRDRQGENKTQYFILNKRQ